MTFDLGLVEKGNWNTIIHSNIPVGNSGLPLKTFRLFWNFPVGQTKIASLLTLQPKFPGIYTFFFVNEKTICLSRVNTNYDTFC